MSSFSTVIRLPSTDGHGEYDFHVVVPAGVQTQTALDQINDIIHEANREDHDNDGVCLDGLSVGENIKRRVADLGFTFLQSLDSTRCWDEYDSAYVAPRHPIAQGTEVKTTPYVEAPRLHLTRQELTALEAAISEETVNHWGWKKTQNGRVTSDSGQIVFRAGFVQAVEKVVAFCGI